MRFDVFISYTRPQERLALEVASWLKDHEYKYWLDLEQTHPDRDVRSDIVEGIANSTTVLCLYDGAKGRSNWVSYELAQADRLGKPVLRSVAELAEKLDPRTAPDH